LPGGAHELLPELLFSAETPASEQKLRILKLLLDE
jgi:hypothetical protein